MNADLLRAKFKEKGKTQAQVAEIVGMSPMSLSRKLSGVRDFRLKEIDKLINALDIDDPGPIFLSKTSQIRNDLPAEHSPESST